MPRMPRPRKPYVQKETNRHGRTVWYFRRGEGKRIRLPGAYESPQWQAAYEAALAGDPVAAKRVPGTAGGTLGWLIERYKDSLAFNSLALTTQAARGRVLEGIKRKAGHWRLSQVTSKQIAAGRDARSKTPAAAHTFVRVVHTMYVWAIDAGHVTENPAAGVKNAPPRTEGHHTWSVAEVEKFCAFHPTGTMARLALDLMLFTGMRISDARRIGRQHIRDGWLHFKPVKTQRYDIEVDMPVLAPLEASIAAVPAKTLTLLATSEGDSFRSDKGASQWFARQCVAAGVPGRAHGLRKAGATIAAMNGATDQQLMAMWGWNNPKQAGVYTRKASRAKLSAEAAGKVRMDEPATSIPAPRNQVRG